MEDCRENLLVDVRDSLIRRDIEPDLIAEILTDVTEKIGKYEVLSRCTDIVIRDDNTEDILRIFAGVLLTEGKSKKTVQIYIRTVQRLCEDVGKPVLKITVFDIRLWLAKTQQTTSLATCENYRSYISAFYSWVAEENYISENPAKQIKPIKTPKVVRLPFSQVELDKLRYSLGPDKKKQRAILEFLISSGVRANELCNILMSDVDFNTMTVLVREGKGGKQRVTYINEICLEHLKSYLADRKYSSLYLFSKRGDGGEPLNVHNVESMMRNLGKMAGVKNVHPHRCRRTFATDLARKGMNIRSIQALMGHSSLDTTMRYITILQEHSKLEYQRFQ